MPDFQTLMVMFFLSWQVKTIAGLILADIGLGIAKAVRAGDFEWTRLAEFYKTNVIPYVLGYLVLYVAVGYIIPAEAGLGETLNEVAVTTAWAALTANLLASIGENLKTLYQGAAPVDLPE